MTINMYQYKVRSSLLEDIRKQIKEALDMVCNDAGGIGEKIDIEITVKTNSSREKTTSNDD